MFSLINPEPYGLTYKYIQYYILFSLTSKFSFGKLLYVCVQRRRLDCLKSTSVVNLCIFIKKKNLKQYSIVSIRLQSTSTFNTA